MADLQFTLDEDQIQEVLFGDRGMAVLMESMLSQVLQSEMTDHLGAASLALRLPPATRMMGCAKL